MLRLLLMVLCIYLSNHFLLRYAFKKKTNFNFIFYLRFLSKVVVIILRILAVAFLEKTAVSWFLSSTYVMCVKVSACLIHFRARFFS